MTTRWILALVLFALPVSAQEPEKGGTPSPDAGRSVSEHVQDLASTDYAVRSRATEALRALGEKARAELEKAARSSNLEQRMRAQALLDELDGARRPPDPEVPDVSRLRPQRRRGREIPDGLRELLERRGRPDMGVILEELRRMERELRSPRLRLERATGPFSGVVTLGGGQRTVRLHRADGTKLEMSRDGEGRVKLEVTRPVDGGEPEKETYEAESLDGFRKEHPEVWERYEDTGIFTRNTGGFTFRLGDPLSGGLFGGNTGGRSMGAWILDGPRLGIEVAPVPEALRAHVQLPEKVLMVERVIRDSTAERMGLARYDLLLSVDGRPVGTARELMAVLARKDHPETLLVEVQRRGKVLKLESPWPRR